MTSSSRTPSSSTLGSSTSSFASTSLSSSAGSVPSTSFPPTMSNNSGSQPPCTNPQGCPNGAPPPATLYLYTFLSTLIILLLVSGGIIARSIVLRRRQQIAIANGTWIPPQRRENYSNRPRPLMFDAYLAVGTHGTKAKIDDEERWSSMKPFSASDISPPPVKSIVVSPPVESVHDLHAPIRRAARAQIRNLMHLHSPFHPPPAPPPPAPPPIELIPQPTTIPSLTEKVRIALLVAMPWQGVPQDKEDDEEFLPHLEFGVLDADVVDVGKASGDEGERERANSGTKS
ncbi:hypothetical protein C8R45DRAFT_1016659 [Mycena sanguinolenta]|nr:hypothetical protein C8R45DRAFT_1016659 [Mycena sanguinolenta]